MSEERAVYFTGDVISTKKEWSRLTCTKPFGNPLYQHPTPSQVTALIEYAGWSNKDTARYLGLPWRERKGSATLRKYKSDTQTSLPIPYATWRLALIYAGIVDCHAPN